MFSVYIARKRESKKEEGADAALLECSHYEETAEPTTTFVTLSLRSDYSVVRSSDGADTEVNAVTCDSDQPRDRGSLSECLKRTIHHYQAIDGIVSNRFTNFWMHE